MIVRIVAILLPKGAVSSAYRTPVSSYASPTGGASSGIVRLTNPGGVAAAIPALKKQMQQIKARIFFS
jgi:hypothetical protein